jgi:erythrocyte band 7 integral membrane protein
VATNEVGLKRSFGRYKETCQPGLNYFNPCTEDIILQNIQTNIIDLPKQKVFTKDNISLTIDTVCFYRVVDPYRASFIVNDLVGSIVQITYVTLRIICGEYVRH